MHLYSTGRLRWGELAVVGGAAISYQRPVRVTQLWRGYLGLWFFVPTLRVLLTCKKTEGMSKLSERKKNRFKELSLTGVIVVEC